MPQEATPASPRLLIPEETLIRPSSPGRVVVGTILALGMYLGLRKLATGLVLASEPDSAEWWLSFDGLTTILGFQVTSALFGAVLAGAARANGFLLGGFVGGLCGALFLTAEFLGGVSSQSLVLFLQPPILVLAGGIAGTIGARIWPAPPDLDIRPPVDTKLSSLALAVAQPKGAERPTAWLRVILGAAVMVAGLAMAEQARQWAQKSTGGALKVESRGQGRFVTWQLGMLAMLGGGVIAGAATGAGLRHGLYAGGLAGIGAVAASISRGEIPVPIAFALSKLNLSTGSGDPADVFLGAISVAIVGLIGGWLGGALFMPLAPPHMRGNRLRVGLD